jgi:hypothetical protein
MNTIITFGGGFTFSPTMLSLLSYVQRRQTVDFILSDKNLVKQKSRSSHVTANAAW